MPLILPGNVASATASTGYDIANSCRWNDGDSPSLKDGDGSAPAGNRQKFTWSIWFKRGTLGTTQTLGTTAHSSSDEGYFQINSDDKFEWDSTESNNGNLITNRLFRDCSAWYNVIVAVDTTQSTAANRMKIYVNGTQETSFATETYPDEDASLYWNVGGSYSPWIGTKYGGDYFDGYITEVANIDNAQLAATSFGEFDSDSPTIWKPIDLDGLTFGTAGYWLDMEDSSNFGNDVSGVGNHFGTVANLAAADQATDTPTNNFCTINPLATPSYITLSEGNTVVTGNNATDMVGTWGTIAVPYAGKYYWEGKVGDVTGTYPWFGVGDVSNAATGRNINGGGTGAHSSAFGSPSFAIQNGGALRVGGATSATYDSYTDDDIISLAIDMDNGASYVAKNGTWMNSGDPTSGASKTGAMTTWTAGTIDGFLPYVGTYYANGSELGIANLNFGCPAYANSSDAADENGYGAFEYAPPSGYYALCTKNLAEFG